MSDFASATSLTSRLPELFGTPVQQAAHVRPGDRLILSVGQTSREHVARLRADLDGLGFTREQVVIIAGIEQMVVVDGTAPR